MFQTAPANQESRVPASSSQRRRQVDKEENVEAFYDPSVGVLGCDGQPKKNPQSIYDPLTFPSNQPLGLGYFMK